MAKEEQEIKLIKAKNKAKIKMALEKNPLLVEMLQTLEDYGRKDIRATINIDQMVDDFSEDSSIQSAIIQEVFEPNENLIREFVEGIRYNINKEENSFAFDEFGGYDAMAAAEQAIAMSYRNSPDYAYDLMERNEINADTLLEEQRNKVLNDILLREKKTRDSIRFSATSLSNEDREFLHGLMVGDLSTEEVKEHVETKTGELTDFLEVAERNGFITTPDKLDMLIEVNKILSTPNITEEEKKVSLAKIASLSETQRYIGNGTGKDSVEQALEAGTKWRYDYLSKKRAEALIDYGKQRRSNYVFSELPFEEKDNILGAAIQTLRDAKSSKEMILAAQAVLADIAPGKTKIIEIEEDRDGNITAKLNPERIISIYNGMRSGANINDIDQAYSYYHKKENETATKKLNGILEYYEEKGSLLSIDDYNSEQMNNERIKFELGSLNSDLAELKRSEERAKSITHDPHIRLEMRVEDILADFVDRETGKTMSHNQKVDVVMATYRALKVSTSFGPEMDVANLEINKKALELLEQHIKSNPIRYGNYINEDKDGNKRIVDRQAVVLDSYRRNGNKYFSNLQSVLAEVQQTAREELFKDSSTAEKLFARDGVEILADKFKDSAKFFIEKGLNVALGEKNAEKVLSSVKSNPIYKALRNGTYKVLGTTHKAATKLSSNVGRALLPVSNRLALFSGNEGLRVKESDLQDIIDYEAHTNFIDTKEELDFLKVAVGYDRLNQKEKIATRRKIENMPYAQKYVDAETGKVDVEKALAVGRDWRKTQIEQRRAQNFVDYIKSRKRGETFADLSDELKYKVVRAAFCTMEDKDIDPRMQGMAIAILKDISPSLISAGQNKDGKIEYKLNNKEFVALFNGLVQTGKVKGIEQARASLIHSEDGIPTEKLDRLSQEGKFLSREEWEKIQEARKVAEAEKRFTISPFKKFFKSGEEQKALNEGQEVQQEQVHEEQSTQETDNRWRVEEAIDKTNRVSKEAAAKVAIRGNEKQAQEIEGTDRVSSRTVVTPGSGDQR